MRPAPAAAAKRKKAPARRRRPAANRPANRAAANRAAANRARNVLPLSGSEETYTNMKFGSPRGIKNNNCYAWAIGHYDNAGGVKLQPGDLARLGGNMSLTSCKDLKARALKDSRAPGQKRMYAARPEQACRAGYYKVMAFLDPTTDYHWYRQHKDVMYRVKAGNSLTSIATKLGVPPRQVRATGNRPAPGSTVMIKDAGVWSHKQGFATGPLLDDACGKAIRDPRKACRNYGAYDYDTFCGAYCVRSGATKRLTRATATDASRANNPATANTGKFNLNKARGNTANKARNNTTNKARNNTANKANANYVF